MGKGIFIDAFKELGNLENYASILSYGIVNPFGPTLMMLATPRKRGANIMTPVYLLKVHPFSPGIEKMWMIPTKEVTTKRELAPIFDSITTGEFSRGGCPTLLITGSIIPKKDSLDVLVDIVANREDGKRTFDNCNAFKGDPFARVGFEVESMFLKYEKQRMTAEEARAFVQMQMEEKIATEETAAFMTAFDGSINHVSLFSPVMDFRDFIGTYAALMN